MYRSIRTDMAFLSLWHEFMMTWVHDMSSFWWLTWANERHIWKIHFQLKKSIVYSLTSFKTCPIASTFVVSLLMFFSSFMTFMYISYDYMKIDHLNTRLSVTISENEDVPTVDTFGVHVLIGLQTGR